VSGHCAHELLNGVPAAEQTVGDCKIVMCHDGAPVPEPQVSDLPVDGLECTDDLCAIDGTPSNPARTIGTGCSQSGGQLCDGAGSCVQCNDPDDCTALPADDECKTRTCVSNQCGESYTLDLTPVNAQVPGDCHQTVCNGLGNTKSVVDDNDVFSDGNDCTVDECTNGTYSQHNAQQGTSCGTNGLCDNNGQCVGCNVAADCGADTDCMWWTCNTNHCAQHFQAPNTLVPGQQTPNDCKKVVCDGNGGQTLANDDADVPVDDGNGCTDEACSNGTPIHPANSAPCDDGQFCNGTDTCANKACTLHAGDPCAGNVGNANNNCKESCNEGAKSCSANDPDGSSCVDGLFCNGTDKCASGVCATHTGDPCAANVGDNDSNCAESCNEATDTCTGNDPVNSFCNDAIYCNGADKCDGNGNCTLHTGNPCSGTNVGPNCNDSCNEGAKNCTAPDVVNTSCDDGIYCNGSDKCNGSGTCTHTGDPCAANVGDNDSNCAESCNEGAKNCTANDPSNSACNDGLYCTLTDKCDGSGNCVGTGSPCPGPDGDSNCKESCNESQKDCSANDPTGSACNDGLFCTLTDQCDANGTCVGTGNPCPGNNVGPKCNDSCNEAAKNCTAADAANTSCDDGLFCNGADRCNSSGLCALHGVNPCGTPNDHDCNCMETCNEGTHSCGADPDGQLCQPPDCGVLPIHPPPQGQRLPQGTCESGICEPI